MPGGPDAFLAARHKELDWFRESVALENEILKAVWLEGADLKKSLLRYDSLRNARIERLQREFGVDVREAEDYEITAEGYARYIESLCKRFLAVHPGDVSMPAQNDLPLIRPIFDGYERSRDKALYNLYNDRYYYVLGFNLSMILEQYYPAYKETLYTREHNFNRYLTLLKNPPGGCCHCPGGSSFSSDAPCSRHPVNRISGFGHMKVGTNPFSL